MDVAKKKGKPTRRETESLLLSAQINAIRTNHIKVRIDKTQLNRKCRLCVDRDETVNLIISECTKLAQKECKTRHDWVVKMIHWELCKKFKFDHTKKIVYAQPRICPEEWNAQTPLGFWDTNGSSNLGQTTRPSNNQQEKENLPNCGLCYPGWPQSKIESEKKDKYLDLTRELKKL